jgi:hypothetical protein
MARIGTGDIPPRLLGAWITGNPQHHSSAYKVPARIIFKRAKKHVATTMTAVSGDISSEVSKTGIFLQ